MVTASAASGSTGGLSDAEEAEGENKGRVDEITALQDGVGETLEAMRVRGI